MPFAWAGAAAAAVGAAGTIYGAVQNADNASNQLAAAKPLQDAQSSLLTKQGAALDKQQGFVDQFVQGEANPAFEAQVKPLEHDIRSDYINALNAATTANNKSLARGGPGLFANQDRRDEVKSRTLASGFDTAHRQAVDTTRGIYQTAAGLQGGVNYGGAATTAGNAANAAWQQGNQSLGSAIYGANQTSNYLNSLSQPSPSYGVPQGYGTVGTTVEGLPWLNNESNVYVSK